MTKLGLKLSVAAALFAGIQLAVAQPWEFSLFQTPVVDVTPISIVAADVNGDGWPDLITASYNNSTLTVLTNNGHWGFGTNAVYLLDPNEYSGLQFVTVADVNGDGYPDLIAAKYDSNDSVDVLTNDGTGVFGLNAAYGGDAGVECAIAADVNGDRKPDLIYVDAWNDSVNVLTNDGTGRFVLCGTNAVGASPISVAAVDVNGDGALDLVTANYGTTIYNGNSLTVLTNDGQGMFGYNATLPVGVRPYWVAAADINGDGWPDLISANYGDGTLSVLTNDGSGGFVTSATLNTDGGPLYVTAADLNGDGKVSLIAAVDMGFDRPGEMEIFTNDGSGNFTVADRLPTGFTPNSIVATDLNRDGRPDLVSANYNDYPSTLSVYFNLPLPAISLTRTDSVTVSWPSLSTGWQLQQNPALATTNWLDTNFPISNDGTNKSVNISPTGNLFFRLAHP